MPRKKKADDANEQGNPTPATGEQQEVATAPVPPPEANGHHPNGEVKRRPAASFAAMTDRTTRIEVACWANQVKTQGGEYTQFSLTVSRSWKDSDGQWHQGGSFRVHDVPVLLHLVQSAYAYCLNQRMDVRVEDAGTPF